MKFSVGDKVKFMDQNGEGVVTKIAGSNLVHVSVDGFELPYSTADLIKVQEPSSTAERMFYEGRGLYDMPEPKNAAGKGSTAKEEKTLEDYGFEAEEEAGDAAGATDTDDDGRISPLRRGFISKNPQPEGVYIALVPQDQQFMLKGDIDFYVVNYTPHTLLYSLATRSVDNGQAGNGKPENTEHTEEENAPKDNDNKNVYYGVDYASIPPYSKILVESIERADMDLWSEGVLQCLFFRDESKQWPEPASYRFKIKGQEVLSPERYTLPVFMREKTLLVTPQSPKKAKEEN